MIVENSNKGIKLPTPAMDSALKRARQQQATIVKLSSDPTLAEGNIENAAKIITEAAAQALDLARVSIWLLSDDRKELKCLNLFEASTKAHSNGMVLSASKYPQYFKALETGRAVDAHDARLDSRTNEFTEEYLIPLGITSMLDAAIRVSGRVVGIVCHEHIGESRTWVSDETTFAGEVADQFAHVLLNRDRRRTEEALQTIAEGTCSQTGDEFFRSLVRSLATALGVRYALVTKCLTPERERARSLAFWAGNDFRENLEYDLEGTPCGKVMEGKIQCYPSNVQDSFPDDKDLVELNAESYIGIPFFDSRGLPLGHLAVLDDRPMEQDAQLMSIFKIFAARAGAEFERKQAEEALQKAYDQLEKRVEERTAELMAENLRKKKVEEALKASESELLQQKLSLEQKTVALQEILGQIEIEKKQIKDDVASNVRDLIIPTLKKLRRKGSDIDIKYIDVIENNLANLTSPFVGRVSDKRLNLSPREVEICHMVKDGLSNKEIAKMLNVAVRTIETHRNRIRKKLKIAHKGINLITYLKSLN